jgi:hypothetical protein
MFSLASCQNRNVLQSDKLHGSVLDVEKRSLTRMDKYVVPNCWLIMTMLHTQLLNPKTLNSPLPSHSKYSINKVRACGSKEDEVTVPPNVDSYSQLQ